MSANMEPPLIEAPVVSTALPRTWCVVACQQGCDEAWTVDTADFTPPLTTNAVEDLLEPLLIAHEVEHGRRW